MHRARLPVVPRWLRVGRVAGLCGMLGLVMACSDRAGDAVQAPGPADAASAAGTPTDPGPAARLQAMDDVQLAQAATIALRENRMYAPAGANALEYYLALRDRQPDSAHVASAVTDLLPYTLIAAEQGLARGDVVEARRLGALLERANPRFPALPRLRRDLATAEEAAAQRRPSPASPRETPVPARESAPPEGLRREPAPAASPEAVPPAAGPHPEAVAAAEREASPAAPPPDAERPAPAPNDPAVARDQAPAAPTPAPRVPSPASPEAVPEAAARRAPVALRAVSTPPPRYPSEALRTGTGGTVVLEFTVGTDGAVSQVRVVRSEPARLFDREAVNAARRWRFEPIESPVTTRRTITFNPVD